MKKFIEKFKEGLFNINVVVAEGNVKLFLRQIIVAVLLCGGLYYYNGQNTEIISKLNSQISSIKQQKEQRNTYLRNKDSVIQMEEYFPQDYEERNEWLRTQVYETFNAHNLIQNYTGGQSLEEAGNMTGASLSFTFKAPYDEAGKLLADFENKKYFIKITEVGLSKDEKDLGFNTYNIKLSTVFLKEKFKVGSK